MVYQLNLEARVQASTDRDALRLMSERLLELVSDKEMSWPSTGHFGGFGYPMSYSLSVLPEEQGDIGEGSSASLEAASEGPAAQVSREKWGTRSSPRFRPSRVRRRRSRLAGGQVRCSFCGKEQKAVRKLIAGPEVYICNECVDLCQDIIVDEIGAIQPMPASVQGVVTEGLQALAQRADQMARDIEGLARLVREGPREATGPPPSAD